MARKTKKTVSPVYDVVDAILDRKGLDLKVLDVSRHCSYADYFVFVTATSSTHAQAIANAVIADFANSNTKIEGYTRGEWVIVDFGDILVHVFQEGAREFYNLDKLWSHVPDISPHQAGPKSESHARAL